MGDRMQQDLRPEDIEEEFDTLPEDTKQKFYDLVSDTLDGFYGVAECGKHGTWEQCLKMTSLQLAMIQMLFIDPLSQHINYIRN